MPSINLQDKDDHTIDSVLLNKLNKLELLVGWTPLKCKNIPGGIKVCFKIEYSNPTGSHKDRIAISMLKDAAMKGLIQTGSCISEMSSGNTAVSLAWASKIVNLRSLLFVQKTSSASKKALIRFLGGNLVEFEPMDNSLEWARSESQKQDCLFLDQSSNLANFKAHYEGTGKEILLQLGFNPDFFIMGIGTGGTITGVGARLKEQGETTIIAVVPTGSPLSSLPDKEGGPIEGLSWKHTPLLIEKYQFVIDKFVDVSPEKAIEGIRMLYREFGLLAGPSTGAVYSALKNLIDNGIVERGDVVTMIAADELSRYPDILLSLSSK